MELIDSFMVVSQGYALLCVLGIVLLIAATLIFLIETVWNFNILEFSFVVVLFIIGLSVLRASYASDRHSIKVYLVSDYNDFYSYVNDNNYRITIQKHNRIFHIDEGVNKERE